MGIKGLAGVSNVFNNDILPGDMAQLLKTQAQAIEGSFLQVSKQVLWKMRRRSLPWTILLCANVGGIVFVKKDGISVRAEV